MIQLFQKADCCGCGACAVSCPKSAIVMITDDAGFLYPHIDATACVNCGLCEKRCPLLHHENGYGERHSLFAAYACDTGARFRGSSGGMFGLFAKKLLQAGGVVYGAAFDEELNLRCKSAESMEELAPLYKSKYLQCETAPAFPEIKRSLESGRPLLFVSTPCQVHALRLFLGKEYPNLLTVDFLCHGVPSQKFFDKCKEYEEKKYGARMTDFRFRTKKKHGATPHYFTVIYEKKGKIKKKTALYTQSVFYYGFQQYITLRDSCYECRFSHSNRCSDITIGDFHGIDKYVSGINRFDGVSTVCTNTEKGRAFWDSVSGDAVVYPLDFKRLYEAGELMTGGTEKPAIRDAFVAALATRPFDEVVKTYLNGSREYSKRFYYSMPSVIRKMMKAWMGIK